MRKVLYLLSELNEQALDWITGAGTRETVRAKQILIEEGKHISDLYITLQGKFSVVTKGKSVAQLGVGEIVGELSFLDSRPPVASVMAEEESTVLSIPTNRLRSKLKTDTAFASQFYRALGVMLAHRLRDTTMQLAFGPVERSMDEDVEGAGEFSPELLDSLNLAAARFESMMQKLEHSAVRAAPTGKE